MENDWLEAIVALPLNMFYNTGIATYIWVLTNRKPDHRRGKVQLIDATAWSRPLRKNLGKKNCELTEDDVDRIAGTFLRFEENEQSRIFDNAEFGYWKVTVERPLRLQVDLTQAHLGAFRETCDRAGETPIANVAGRVAGDLGEGPHDDFNTFFWAIEADADSNNVKLTAKRLRLLRDGLTDRREDAAPVIRRMHKAGKSGADPLHGLYEATIGGKPFVVEYEPDTALRDTETVPLKEPGGIDAFIRREVLPHVPDAWVDTERTATGYEISFTRYFYKPQPLRSLDEIRADILALERETEGLMADIIGAGR
jgi:type I restriction enzyme M protein